MEKLIDTLNAFGQPGVVLVGDFMLDEYVYGDVERISPEAPVPVLRVNRREYRSGGAGNAAAAIGALHGRVSCVGVIGNDAAGCQLADLLKDAGADTSGLIERDDRPTTSKTRYVGLAQHKNPHQILRVDEELTDTPDDELRRQILAAVTKAVSAGKPTVAIQDHNKGVLADTGAQEIIAVARQAGCEVIVDPALIDDYSRYRGATLLTPNRFEARLASGVDITDEASLEKAGRKILEITEARGLVITLDRQGAYLLTAAGPGRLIPPIRPHEVSDGTGAGDAVMAMLSVAVAEGCPLPDAVMLANVAGGLEVERFGVVPITPGEIKAELRRAIGMRRSKIMDREALAVEFDHLRREGTKIVFTNGCFDLMHMGHVTYLQQSREHGGCLVVAVNSDDSVRRLKGPTRPICSQDERASMLAALECVDYVTIFDEDTPAEVLEVLRPDVLIKGGSTSFIVGKEFVEGYGGQVHRLGLVEGRSTTEIINKIVKNYDNNNQ